MKTFIIAAGALALTSTAAFAQSAYSDAGYGAQASQGEVYAEPTGATSGYVSPSASTEYPAVDDGYNAPASGFQAQTDTQARAWTPNMGAGTSRSNAANNG